MLHFLAVKKDWNEARQIENEEGYCFLFYGFGDVLIPQSRDEI